MDSSPGGAGTAGAPAAAPAAAATRSAVDTDTATDPPEWRDIEPEPGYPISHVVIRREGRWQTVARCAHPHDARDIAETWAAELVTEVWEQDGGADGRRLALHLEPAVGRS